MRVSRAFENRAFSLQMKRITMAVVNNYGGYFTSARAEDAIPPTHHRGPPGAQPSISAFLARADRTTYGAGYTVQ